MQYSYVVLLVSTKKRLTESDNILSAKQQEFVKSIISYVQQNGDITKQDLVDKSPFSDFDVVGLFDDKIDVLVSVIDNLHESILVA